MKKFTLNQLLWHAKKAIQREEGSASIEFVALALPLFIPIFIFLGQFMQNFCMQDLCKMII
jgi:Flp pilus assembly protein TadG